MILECQSISTSVCCKHCFIHATFPTLLRPKQNLFAQVGRNCLFHERCVLACVQVGCEEHEHTNQNEGLDITRYTFQLWNHVCTKQKQNTQNKCVDTAINWRCTLGALSRRSSRYKRSARCAQSWGWRSMLLEDTNENA
jgi:hypothetical protein